MLSSIVTTRNNNATVALHAGALTLELAPAVGGAIARFFSTHAGHRHHWLRPASEAAIEAADIDGMASFPLVPFCNRLRHGRASFDGRQIAIPPNRVGSPHPAHGVGWQQPWLLTAHDGQSAQLEMDHAGSSWPYPFHATQLMTLREDHLTVTMEVENRGSLPMPLGLGHHPHFPNRANATLTVDVQGMWGNDAALLPTVPEVPALLGQLRQGVALAALVRNNDFIGWNRKARIDWSPSTTDADRFSLLMTTEAPLDHVLLCTATEQDFFCLAPVGNCTDWLNLTAFPHGQIGGSVVAPGQSERATLYLEPIRQTR